MRKRTTRGLKGAARRLILMVILAMAMRTWTMSQKLVPMIVEMSGTVETRKKMMLRAMMKETTRVGMNLSSTGSLEAWWYSFDTAKGVRMLGLKIQMSLLLPRMP
jgi:hypothetical protein